MLMQTMRKDRIEDFQGKSATFDEFRFGDLTDENLKFDASGNRLLEVGDLANN